MLIIVSRKPTQICSVNAVPTSVLGLYSETSAENCAESATIENPHTTPNSSSTGSGAPKTRPAASAQDPLVSIAPPAIRAFPQASPQSPAITHPMDPLA